MRKHAWWGTPVLMVIVAALAACGGSENGGEAHELTSTPSAVSTSQSTASATATTATSGELSLQEYFSRLAALSKSSEERAGAIVNDTGGIEGSERILTPERRDKFEHYYRQFQVIFADYLAELERLDPPDEIQDLHDALVRAYRDLGLAFGQSVDKIQEQTLVSELFALIQTSQPYSKVAADACQELAQAAASRNIQIELGCAQ